MKLFDFAIAPNPRRVTIFLAEKGVEIETVQVDLRSGEHKTAEFTALNPMQDVPLLQLDDGSCISQVNAICRYLEESFPEPPLYGRTAAERARVESWNHLIQNNGILAVTEAYRNSSPYFANRAVSGPNPYAQIPELAERGLQRIGDFFTDMNSHFADNQFVMGNYFSVADITAYITVDFAQWVKMPIPDNCTHLQRWFEQVGSRPSINK